jgi:hypothetical protein
MYSNYMLHSAHSKDIAGSNLGGEFKEMEIIALKKKKKEKKNLSVFFTMQFVRRRRKRIQTHRLCTCTRACVCMCMCVHACVCVYKCMCLRKCVVWLQQFVYVCRPGRQRLSIVSSCLRPFVRAEQLAKAVVQSRVIFFKRFPYYISLPAFP